MKKVLLIVGLTILVVIAAGGIYFWKSYQDFIKVETVSHDPQLTIYLGGGNSIVLTSEDGASALIVDTKMRGAAQILKNQVKAKDITIVNTHDHFDHVGGNALYPQAKIIAGAYTKEQWDEDSDKTSRYPDVTLKPGEEKIMKIGSETVHIFNTGRAHTWNDVVVYLENRKLLVSRAIWFFIICTRHSLPKVARRWLPGLTHSPLCPINMKSKRLSPVTDQSAIKRRLPQ